MRQFHQITAALAGCREPSGRGEAGRLEGEEARRWDLLANCAGARGGSGEPPLLSLEAVQHVLAPDEAVLGYFFLGPRFC